MKNIISKLNQFYSDGKFLLALKKENEVTKIFKKELSITTEEANVFGILLTSYIKEGCSVFIKEICEDFGIPETHYIKIMNIVFSLEDKGYLIIYQKRGRSSRIINPEIEIDELTFRKLIFGKDIIFDCDFSNIYSIVETVSKLVELKEDDEKISLKFFKEKMEEIIKNIDKKLYIHTILSKYSIKENILFLMALVNSMGYSWSDNTLSIDNYAGVLELNLKKRMELIDKIIEKTYPIFRDEVLEIEIDKDMPFLTSTVDLNIKVNNDILSKIFNRKVNNLNFKSKFLSHISPEDFKQKLFFDEKFKKEIDKIKTFLSKKKFKAVTKKLTRKGFSKGIVMLFYGYPGTGKTATVYDIAKSTGREVFQVNISQAKSMWVGESEKNMKEIFKHYEIFRNNLKTEPILLFNEADSLISKRINVSDSVDQMSNSLQNILLEELENFQGIFMATTNLTENIDPAFDRRFLYKLEFKKPNKETIKKIWKYKLPELDEDVLGKVIEFEITGGQIDNIAKKIVINSILENKTIDLDELITYIKEEKDFRKDSEKQVGFVNNQKK